MGTIKVCAPSHQTFSSKEIAQHKERVKKLQMRMVKAVELTSPVLATKG